MKKIFTLIAAALMAVGAFAQTDIISYTGQSAVTAGITLGSSNVSIDSKKYNKDKTTVKVISLANGYTTDNKYNDNAIILDYAGGFKAGDIITICGFINNSSDTKQGSVILFTVAEDKTTTEIDKYENSFVNGKLVEGDPTEAKFVLENDYDRIYIGRYAQSNATGTYISTLKVTRGGTIAEVAPTISIPETAGGFIGNAINIAATVTGFPTPSIQWFLNGSEIEGATANSYQFTSNTAGTYTITAKATNSKGNATSNACTVTISDPNVVVSEKDEIVVTEALAGKTFNGVTLIGGKLKLSFYDKNNKVVAEPSAANHFGTEEQSTKVTGRLKSGNGTSESLTLTLNSTVAGTLYICARSANSTETRTITMNSTVISLKDTDAKAVEGVGTVYPIFTAPINSGDNTIELSAGINIYSLSLEDPVATAIKNVETSSTVSAKKMLKDGQIVIETAKGTFNVAGALMK